MLLDCAVTIYFMWKQTAQRAQLPLYSLTHPGPVMTAGRVQVKIWYYMTACVRIGEVVFRPHFKVLDILPGVVLGIPRVRISKERNADILQRSTLYQFASMDPEIPPGYSSKQLRSTGFFRHFYPVPRKQP